MANVALIQTKMLDGFYPEEGEARVNADNQDADAAGQELLRRVIELGDPDAYGELVERFQAEITAHARQYTRSDAEADDLAQEVFLKVWRAMIKAREKKDRTIAGFRTLLHVVVKNTAISEWRRGQCRVDGNTKSLEADAERHAEEGGLDIIGQESFRQWLDKQAANNELMIEIVRMEVERMGEPDRSVLKLRFYEGMSVEEVSKHLNLSQNHVAVITHRSLIRLRKRIIARLEQQRREGGEA